MKRRVGVDNVELFLRQRRRILVLLIPPYLGIGVGYAGSSTANALLKLLRTPLNDSQGPVESRGRNADLPGNNITSTLNFVFI